MKLTVKKISEKHLKEAHKIYNYYIINSYSNFEEKKLTFKQFHINYKNVIKNKLPYLVALSEKKVVGLAYLNRFREKSGYRFAFENTIYVHDQHTRQGIGYKLLKELLYISKNHKNIKLIVAVIGSIDSKGSVKLHEKLGFKKTGVLKKIGFKNNKWIDSIFLQKNL
jgi:L-amino acid N-acyltransferase YncA